MSPTTPAPAPADPRRLSRRTTFAAAAGALLAPGLTACTSGPAPRAAAARRPAARDADEDPDSRLLAAALDSIDEVVVVLTAVRRRERALRDSLDPLLRLHGAHREVLADASPHATTPRARSARVPRGPGPALAIVQQRERALAARLAEAAVDAESGTFARALASMAAGIEQHLAVHLRGAA